jgi:hypothetical protein
LYAGNPKRATAHPTAESLLRAFKGLAYIPCQFSGVAWTLPVVIQ